MTRTELEEQKQKIRLDRQRQARLEAALRELHPLVTQAQLDQLTQSARDTLAGT